MRRKEKGNKFVEKKTTGGVVWVNLNIIFCFLKIPWGLFGKSLKNINSIDMCQHSIGLFFLSICVEMHTTLYFY